VPHHFSEPSAAPALQQRAAGLLLSTRRAVDIDRMLLPDAGLPAAAVPQQQKAAAASAGSATLTTDVGS